MINMTTRLNQQIKIPFADPNGTTGITTFSYTILKDGVSYVGITPTFDEISGGIYTAEVSFTETGYYTFIAQGSIAAVIDVVEKDVYDILKDLDDVAQGSWVYDKAAGTLTLIRQDGNDLASFSVVDDNNTSSRERIS